MNDLIENINKLHTTELGAERIKRNLQIETSDVVQWCKTRILDKSTVIEKTGKNWYAAIGHCIITVNAHSYTIITAHKVKGESETRLTFPQKSAILKKSKMIENPERRFK